VNALEVRELTLRFGAVAALSEVSFDVAEGELFAVIGPNGAGKTSLFNILSRLYQPTSGTVRYHDTDLLPLRAHHLPSRGVARTFQNLGLFPNLSVLDNVLIGRGHMMGRSALRSGLRLPGVRAEEARHAEAARSALGFVGLESIADRPVAVLPYGVRKRVEIARALAMEPSLLLLDEPVAGMSRSERREITELIAAIRQQRAVTIVLVEHDMGVVMSIAQRVLVLDFGRRIACGTPDEVQRDPHVIAAYLGAVEAEPAAAAAS
jgi:branched-chain amino acid transport system ATP-binding protein